MAARVDTRYATRLSRETPTQARRRRASERSQGITSVVVVAIEEIPPVTLLHCKGQQEPVIMHEVQQHHPHCADTAKRPCECDCNDMEWWAPRSHF